VEKGCWVFCSNLTAIVISTFNGGQVILHGNGASKLQIAVADELPNKF
jgi:hypothetical protein